MEVATPFTEEDDGEEEWMDNDNVFGVMNHLNFKVVPHEPNDPEYRPPHAIPSEARYYAAEYCRMQDEIERLGGELAAKALEHQEELNSANEKVKEIEKDKKAVERRLGEDIVNLNKKISKLDDAEKEYKTKINELETQIETYNSAMIELNRLRDNENKMRVHLEHKMEEMSVQHKAEMEEIKKTASDHENKIREYSNVILEQKQRIKETDTKLLELDSRVEKTTQEKIQLESKLEESEMTINYLQNERESNKATFESLQIQYKEESEKARTDLDAKELELKGFKEQEKRIEETTQLNIQLEQKISDLENDVKRLEESFDSEIQEKSKVQERFQILHENLRNFHAELYEKVGERIGDRNEDGLGGSDNDDILLTDVREKLMAWKQELERTKQVAMLNASLEPLESGQVHPISTPIKLPFTQLQKRKCEECGKMCFGLKNLYQHKRTVHTVQRSRRFIRQCRADQKSLLEKGDISNRENAPVKLSFQNTTHANSLDPHWKVSLESLDPLVPTSSTSANLVAFGEPFMGESESASPLDEYSHKSTPPIDADFISAEPTISIPTISDSSHLISSRILRSMKRPEVPKLQVPKQQVPILMPALSPVVSSPFATSDAHAPPTPTVPLLSPPIRIKWEYPCNIQQEGDDDAPPKHRWDWRRQHLGFFCCCGHKAPNKSALQKHLKYHATPSFFKCQVCLHRTFKSTSRLKWHMKQAHKMDYRLKGCGRCGRLFLSLKDLELHQISEHSWRPRGGKKKVEEINLAKLEVEEEAGLPSKAQLAFVIPIAGSSFTSAAESPLHCTSLI